MGIGKVKYNYFLDINFQISLF